MDKQEAQKNTQQVKQQQQQTLVKDPETLSQGERMGLSKQQLRKLQKKLAAEAKKKKKQQQAANKVNQQKQKGEKKQKGKAVKNQIVATNQQINQFNGQKIKINPNKQSPSQGKTNTLITSALPYVNNVPHLGNIIGCVLSADVYARHTRLQNHNTLYICGTDQYGTATQIRALGQGKTPRQICDHYHKIHKGVYQWFDISFDHFGRTSTQWHSQICQQIFKDLNSNGLIIKDKMVQCYCQKCQKFLADRFVGGTCPFCQYPDARGDQCDKCQKLFNSPIQMKNPFCTICNNTPIQKQTQHYFINLPQIQQDLQKWVQKSSIEGKWSQNSISMTKAWLNLGLKSKCITRDLKWGVQVPKIQQGQQMDKKVFYVWYDAPIGYPSITANLLGQDYKNWWKNPQNVKLYQFMGKDNVPFHTVIFPSSLIGTKQNWTKLHHISTTQYLNYQNGKFSKRNGTGVFGDSAAQTGIPSQVWRYYLLVNRPEKSDSQFSWSDFISKNNSQLLANLGNLCNRVMKFAYSQYNKSIPKVDQSKLSEIDNEFINNVEQKYKRYVQLLNNVQIKQGLKLVMEISSLGNKYLQDSKFWLAQNKTAGITQNVIAISLNFFRVLSLILEPYLPSTSAKINYLLGLQREQSDQILGYTLLQNGVKNMLFKLTQKSKGLKTPIPLFKQYTQQQVAQWRKKFGGNQIPVAQVAK